MIRRRAAALHALAAAAVWTAACAGGSSPYRAAPSSSAPSSYEVAHAGAGDATVEGEAHAAPAERPGLGTEYGESVSSRVDEQPFQRAAAEPFALVALHYNDEEGVRAQADSRDGALSPLIATTPQGGLSVALVETPA